MRRRVAWLHSIETDLVCAANENFVFMGLTPQELAKTSQFLGRCRIGHVAGVDKDVPRRQAVRFVVRVGNMNDADTVAGR
jgi:hypothetical protein